LGEDEWMDVPTGVKSGVGRILGMDWYGFGLDRGWPSFFVGDEGLVMLCYGSALLCPALLCSVGYPYLSVRVICPDTWDNRYT
jgi:hypothetical protein